MTGVNKICEAKKLKNDVTSILESAGFHLRKWISNKDQLLTDTLEGNTDLTSIEIEESTSVKVLGLHWNQKGDYFCFRVNLQHRPILTKRGILSEASRLFDPIGWLAPVIVKMKIFFQDLWIENLGWDEQLPINLTEKWLKLRDSLPHIEKIKIPRHIQTTSNTDMELHGFSVASKEAYSAVYSRVIQPNGETTITLLSAKTKVAPVKQISIPRLELCGALLLSNLLRTLKETLRTKIINIYAWTDSTIVLDWLSAHPKHWNTFVGNRTSEILTHMSRAQWNHVKSEENHADCASRGKKPDQLLEFNLWWNGPKWLKNPNEWPSQYKNNNTTMEERKTHSLPIQLPEFDKQILEKNVVERIIDKFSSFAKMVSILAYVLRIFQRKPRIRTAYLQTAELIDAERRLIQTIQRKRFAEELNHITLYAKLQKSSNLKSLQPFIDAFGILRVAGRLSNANLLRNQTLHNIAS